MAVPPAVRIPNSSSWDRASDVHIASEVPTCPIREGSHGSDGCQPRPTVAFLSTITASTRFPGPVSGGSRLVDDRGFTLIELLIVTVIIGLLAAIAIPKFDDVRQRAYNSAALSDLHSVALAIEEYFADNHALPEENQLINAGFALSEGVSLMKFSIRDPDTEDARVHIHIAHQGSFHYYHYEYPGNEPPEKRWK